MKPCPPCPVCGGAFAEGANVSDQSGHRYSFSCARCGRFALTEECYEDLEGELARVPNGSALLSHTICRASGRKENLTLTSERLTNILDTANLPKPPEQLERLILLLGREQKGPGAPLVAADRWVAEVGALDDRGLEWVMAAAVAAGFAESDSETLIFNFAESSFQNSSLLLTLEGWRFYDELLRGQSDSDISFMAMKFGDEQLNRIVADYISPAVHAAGFELLNLQDSEKAGLIDDRIRVEIRRSRFLLADLTHHSNGAYWEAGFAEGLGKPVIYLCRRDVFNDKDKTTHFDTNHHLTIDWSEDTIQEDMERLKATIRATLPSEARMED